MADIKITPEVNTDKKDIIDTVLAHVADLDLIIANADTATTAQLRNALRILAQGQKRIIKRLIQIR
jgi:hypothetical protein